MTLRNLSADDPVITLDFQKSKKLDPRVTFTRASYAPASDPSSGTGTSGGTLQEFNINVPRLTDQGLLIEESRTNYLADYLVPDIRGNIPVDDYAIAAYSDNTFGAAHNAHSWTFSAESGRNTLLGYSNPNNISTAGNGQQYAISGWVKANQAYTLDGDIRDQRRNNVQFTWNLTTEWQYFYATTPANVNDDGSGAVLLRWWRGVQGIPSGLQVDFACVNFERGGFPTSFIPVDSSAPNTTVTRAPDICTITGINFSSWYNQPIGTVCYSFNSPIEDATGYYAMLITADISSTLDGYSFDLPRIFPSQPNGANGWSSVADWLQTDYIQNAENKIAFTYDRLGNYNAVANNGTFTDSNTSATDASVSPAALTIGGADVGDGFAGYFSRISYYPARVPDTALGGLTQP